MNDIPITVSHCSFLLKDVAVYPFLSSTFNKTLFPLILKYVNVSWIEISAEMYDNSHFHLKFFSVSLITGSLLSIILGRLGKLPLDAHDAIFCLSSSTCTTVYLIAFHRNLILLSDKGHPSLICLVVQFVTWQIENRAPHVLKKLGGNRFFMGFEYTVVSSVLQSL